MDYSEFLKAKVKMAHFGGFDVPKAKLNQILKAHQKDIVQWAIQGGNRAIFASFGLGKSVMQIECDYEFHVRLGEELEQRGALPSTFMSLAPGSHHPDVWHDVTRMLTLNSDQSRRAVEKHVCPLQFDIVDRLIDRYSQTGETVYDPFCGLGTVPYRAILKGRKGGGSELNPAYFLDQVHYLQAAEREFSMPSLFDMMEDEVTQ